MCVYKYSSEKITKLVLLLEGHPCAQAFTCGDRGHTFLTYCTILINLGYSILGIFANVIIIMQIIDTENTNIILAFLVQWYSLKGLCAVYEAI